jgi:hypothetical protein
MQIYRISEIGAAQVDKAYPLISAVDPKLGLEAWRTVCRRVNCPVASTPSWESRRIAVASNARGYIQGLAVFAPLQHPVHGRVLNVSVFAVVSAADVIGVMDELYDYLKHVARTEACCHLRLQSLRRIGAS